MSHRLLTPADIDALDYLENVRPAPTSCQHCHGTGLRQVRDGWEVDPETGSAWPLWVTENCWCEWRVK